MRAAYRDLFKNLKVNIQCGSGEFLRSTQDSPLSMLKREKMIKRHLVKEIKQKNAD